MADNLKEQFSEWVDSPVLNEVHGLSVPEPNDDYAYTATRILHWWPERNSKGLSFFPEDITDAMLAEYVGRQVNLDHDKAKVTGNVRTLAKTSQGVEAIIEIDRDQTGLHGIDLSNLGPDAHWSGVSVELTRDPFKSQYIFHDENNVIKETMSSDQADRLGISRTTAKNPVKYKDLIATERCVPARFTGIGLTWHPADKKAQIYKIAANDTENVTAPVVFSRVDAESLKVAASSETITQETIMTPEQIEALQAELAAAKSEVEKLKTKETASSADFAKIDAERRELKAELITRDAEALMKFADEAERAKFKETASLSADEAGVVRELLITRENAALKAELAAARKAAAEEKAKNPPVVLESRPGDDLVVDATEAKPVAPAVPVVKAEDKPADPVKPVEPKKETANDDFVPQVRFGSVNAVYTPQFGKVIADLM